MAHLKEKVVPTNPWQLFVSEEEQAQAEEKQAKEMEERRRDMKERHARASMFV
jgi:hypothetical protein